MSWNRDNEAHRYLWAFVRSIHIEFATDGGHVTTFEEGGEWKNDFIIGAVGASPDMKLVKAKVFSQKLNAWLLVNFPVEYEQGINANDAIAEIAEAFATKEKLGELGDIVDGKYNFPSERTT